MNVEAHLLDQAIDKFQSEHADGVLSVNRVINPLLEIWKLAEDIDHTIAVPIERLLIALTGRKMTTPLEIAAAIEAARLALELLVSA